jgi:hypothetical protein
LDFFSASRDESIETPMAMDLLVVLVIVVMLAVSVLRYLDRAEKELKESKWVRTTSGTVLRKEVFVCREPTCFYLGYGKRAEMKSGESQTKGLLSNRQFRSGE